MSKDITISVYLGKSDEGQQRLEQWRQAAAMADCWHGDTPAVGKWLASLADREIEKGEKEMYHYEVVSGMPNGEAYHRECWICKTKRDAEDCTASIYDSMQEHERDSWLWGPHIYGPFRKKPSLKTWSGFEMVPAPVWGSSDEFPHRC